MKKEHKSIIANLTISICVFLFILFLFRFLGVFQTAELKGLDILFNWRGSRIPSDKIVILSIDDRSFEELGVFPWPRSIYATVIDNLKKAGAKLICFDVEFATSGSIKENDILFAKAVKKAGNVVSISTFTEDINEAMLRYKKHNLPIEILRNSLAGFGFSSYEREIDGFVRKAQLFTEYNSKTFYTFPVKVLSLYLNVSDEYIVNKVRNKYKGFKDTILINYTGPVKTFETIPFFTAVKVKDGTSLNIFKDKIVLIGSTAPILHDEFYTSFRLLPGVELHANVINNILKEDYLIKASDLINNLILLVMILVSSFFAFKFSPFKSIIFNIGFIVVFLIVAFYLFISDYWINTSTSLWAVVFSYTANVAYKAVTEGKRRKQIKNMFQRYVSRQIVEELLKDTDKLKLGGKRERVTIFFSDIRNFTTLSEKLEPEEVVDSLNKYFTEMTNIIFKYGGTVDKFMGDAIMALFGVPVKGPNDEESSVRAAIEMQERMKKLRDLWKGQAFENLEIGIGINSGDVIVGNIGSDIQRQYTVIGDTANIASRLETLTKEYKASIIISDSVYDKVKDIILVKDLGESPVKGKTEKVKIYEVLGLKKL
ncbi:MAG: adenylate/guanylate cyclase domain-containing protein [Candidatus Firestonebacteria bacterium]